MNTTARSTPPTVAAARLTPRRTLSRHVGKNRVTFSTWRLTLALSGRPPRHQARGRRKLNGALAARRSGALHRPLERVVRHPHVPLPDGLGSSNTPGEIGVRTAAGSTGG